MTDTTNTAEGEPTPTAATGESVHPIRFGVRSIWLLTVAAALALGLADNLAWWLLLFEMPLLVTAALWIATRGRIVRGLRWGVLLVGPPSALLTMLALVSPIPGFRHLLLLGAATFFSGALMVFAVMDTIAIAAEHRSTQEED